MTDKQKAFLETKQIIVAVSYLEVAVNLQIIDVPTTIIVTRDPN